VAPVAILRSQALDFCRLSPDMRAVRRWDQI
jgi:hypothetical protein